MGSDFLFLFLFPSFGENFDFTSLWEFVIFSHACHACLFYFVSLVFISTCTLFIYSYIYVLCSMYIMYMYMPEFGITFDFG